MKSSNIGGQAVIEGVMMKNKERYAVAVRKPDGEIEVTTDTYKSVVGKYTALTKLPIQFGLSLRESSALRFLLPMWAEFR